MLNNNTVIKNTLEAVRKSISKDRFTDRSREINTSLNTLSRKDISIHKREQTEGDSNIGDSFQCQIGSPRVFE